jgi:restriction system protein
MPILDYSAYWFAADTFVTGTAWLELTPAGEIYKRFSKTKACPYCRERAVQILGAYLPQPADAHDIPYDYDRKIAIWGCLSCGWWCEQFEKWDGPDDSRVKRRVAVLREFTHDASDVPLAALTTELRAHPSILHHIHPERLEALVADVLRDHFCTEVKVIGRTGDGGIDLVFVNGERPFAVQVKRRESPASKEGVALVREFLGACVLQDFRNGIIVTTAGAFTSGAVATATRTISKGIFESFDLIAKDRFLALFARSGRSTEYPWTRVAESWIEDWESGQDVEIHLDSEHLRAK